MKLFLAGRQAADNIPHEILLSGTVGMTIACATTVLRLVLRIRRLWWDDWLAIAALLFLIVTAVTGKMYYSMTPETSIPQSSRVALYYIFAATFDLTIWTSRLSVLFNVIRFGFYRRRLYIAAIFFTIAMLILVSQVFWVCESQNRTTGWKMNPIPMCVLGRQVAVTQITTDFFADSVLVSSPLLLLRYLKSEQARALRIRLTASFAIGGLTTIVSIVHTVYLVRALQLSIVVSNVELSVSVIICNFTVLAAAGHRLWKKLRPRAPDATMQSSMQFKTRRLPQSESETMDGSATGTLEDSGGSGSSSS